MPIAALSDFCGSFELAKSARQHYDGAVCNVISAKFA